LAIVRYRALLGLLSLVTLLADCLRGPGKCILRCADSARPQAPAVGFDTDDAIDGLLGTEREENPGAPAAAPGDLAGGEAG
jgi:hypothetical protein